MSGVKTRPGSGGGGCLGSFATTWRALWRGRSAWVLLAVTALAFACVPDAARSDGSAAGQREMLVKLSVGSAYAVVFVGMLAAACGLVADARERGLLALERVRPASAFAALAGRWLALSCVAAVALAVTAAALVTQRGAPACRLHRAPVLPPAVDVAERQMAGFLADPKTSDDVRKAPRADVLAHLTNKERERYETVPPGGTVTWRFDGAGDALAVRFATLADNRATVSGTFRAGAAQVAVTNRPSVGLEVALNVPAAAEVTFTNAGRENLLFRPRRDVTLLETGDSFAANWARAYGAMLAGAALAAAFGLFLSCWLSRPVATFAAFTFLAAALIAPSAVEQFPNAFHATVGERIGLWVSRQVMTLVGALGDVSPVGDLATGRAIAWPALARTLVTDLAVGPFLFLLSGAALLRLKTETSR